MNGNESIYYHPERSGGCNAADEVREARLSIRLPLFLLNSARSFHSASLRSG